MNKKKFQEKYQIAKVKYQEIESKGTFTALEEIYLHEVRGSLVNQIEGYGQLYKGGEIDETLMDKVINENKNRLERILSFEPLLEIEEFSRKGLQTQNPTNLRDILEGEKNFYLKKYGIDINIKGNQEISTYLNPVALKAFISTNIGDAVKWSPEKKEINISINQENENIKLSIKNKFGLSPLRKEIGMGEKIGSKYTKLFIETLGGEIIEKIEQPNSSKAYGIYFKEFTFPKN